KTGLRDVRAGSSPRAETRDPLPGCSLRGAERRGAIAFTAGGIDEVPEPPEPPRTGLDELLSELNSRLENELSSRGRVHALLEAVLSIGGDLDLATVLRRLAQAAAAVAGPRYPGLGVLGEDGEYSEIIPVGRTPQEVDRVGRLPPGAGILTVPSTEHGPLRTRDLTEHPRSVGFPPNHPRM